MRTRLVERARDGDDVAFSELVDLDGDQCYAIAYRILRDVERAQDAVQQAFLLAWRELPRLRDPERFSPWLHRLLVNACYEEHRRHRRWTSRIRALPVDGPVSADPTVSVDDRDALDRAFLRLTPQHRAVFVLHHHAGLPLADIADIVGVPVGTVKSRLHHATRSLRAALVADSQVEFHGGTTGMNQPRDPDATIASWLDDGPERPAGRDPAGDLGRSANTASRTADGLPGGSSMLPLNRLAAAAVVVLAVGALSPFVLSNRSSGAGAGATPAASISAPPSGTSARPRPHRALFAPPWRSISTGGWVDFSSSSLWIRHLAFRPLDRVRQAVDRDWSLASTSRLVDDGRRRIRIGPPRFTVFADEVPAGPPTIVDRVLLRARRTGIAGPMRARSSRSRDHAGRRPSVDFWTELGSGDCAGTAGFVFIGHRAYVLRGRPASSRCSRPCSRR